jgi:polyisoprenoid-binding protein YceI
MRFLKRPSASFALLMIAGCASLVAPKVRTEPAALRAGEYRIDPNHRALLFRIDHSGYSHFVGRFESFEIALDFDASDVAAAHVEAEIDMASLDVALDDFARTLTGPNWFDAAAYPKAVFRSTSVQKTGENTGRVMGDLTLHGVTAPITLDVAFNGGAQDILRGGYVVGFSAKGTISRKAFGVDRYESLVGDAVDIEIEAELVKS